MAVSGVRTTGDGTSSQRHDNNNNIALIKKKTNMGRFGCAAAASVVTGSLRNEFLKTVNGLPQTEKRKKNDEHLSITDYLAGRCTGRAYND
jgi:hypothetical protein